MKWLMIGVLAAVLSLLLTAAVLIGYHEDQNRIRWFPGTGIAGKVDVIGGQPAYLSIEDDMTGAKATVGVQADGSFIAPLEPGTYRLQLADDSRSITVAVPAGHCVDVVLDFRVPLIVLTVPGEGWPIPG